MRSNRLAAAMAVAAVLALTVSQTALAAHPFYKAGEGGIAPTWGMDLDTGDFNILPGADLFLDAVSKKLRYIDNNGGATILRMASKPGYSACAHAALGDHNYNTANNVGRWFCVKTDENRFARFKIVSNTPGSYLVIKYLTWCKVGDPC